MGNLLQRLVLDKEGPQRLVAAVQGLGRLTKEVKARGIVHGAVSRIVTGFGAKRAQMVWRECSFSARSTTARLDRNAEILSTEGIPVAAERWTGLRE